MEKKTTALDNMNQLYQWLTTWDKYVQKDTRERDSENKEENTSSKKKRTRD